FVLGHQKKIIVRNHHIPFAKGCKTKPIGNINLGLFAGRPKAICAGRHKNRCGINGQNLKRKWCDYGLRIVGDAEQCVFGFKKYLQRALQKTVWVLPRKSTNKNRLLLAKFYAVTIEKNNKS